MQTLHDYVRHPNIAAGFEPAGPKNPHLARMQIPVRALAKPLAHHLARLWHAIWDDGSLPIGRNRTSSFTPHGAIGRNLPPKGFEPSCSTPCRMPFAPMNYGRHSGPTKALSFDMVPEVGFEPTYAVAYGAFGTLPYEGSACLPIASHRLNMASMPCLERAICSAEHASHVARRRHRERLAKQGLTTLLRPHHLG